MQLAPMKLITAAGGCVRCASACWLEELPLYCLQCRQYTHRECSGLPPSAFISGLWRCPSCLLQGVQAAATSSHVRMDAERLYRMVAATTSEQVQDQHLNRLRQYVRYCQEHLGWGVATSLPLAPGQPMPADAVCLFLSHKSFTLVPESLRAFLTTIDKWHLEKDLPPVSDTVPYAKQVIQSAKTAEFRNHGRGPKTALSLDLLAAMLSLLQQRVDAAQSVAAKCRWARERSLLELGFFGLFRKSELRALDARDVSYDAATDTLVLRLAMDKTNHTGVPRTVGIPAVVPMGSIMVGDHLFEYISLCKQLGATADAPLFPNLDTRSGLLAMGKRLASEAVSLILRGLLRDLCAESGTSIPVQAYASHSLRRGGATLLKAMGVPLEDIQRMGRWKSLTVLLYLQIPVQALADNWRRGPCGGGWRPWSVTVAAAA